MSLFGFEDQEMFSQNGCEIILQLYRYLIKTQKLQSF